ncbi:hypothetical protein ACTVZO_00500 [Streptomyces sp. IBSNAI002]|uniref:hypothetical protein n=1 Tax=Streptomyces sp. IBSNAI002 TaxID=3457500 RepID=UPI003FD6A83F
MKAKTASIASLLLAGAVVCTTGVGAASAATELNASKDATTTSAAKPRAGSDGRKDSTDGQAWDIYNSTTFATKFQNVTSINGGSAGSGDNNPQQGMFLGSGGKKEVALTGPTANSGVQLQVISQQGGVSGSAEISFTNDGSVPTFSSQGDVEVVANPVEHNLFIEDARYFRNITHSRTQNLTVEQGPAKVGENVYVEGICSGSITHQLKSLSSPAFGSVDVLNVHDSGNGWLAEAKIVDPQPGLPYLVTAVCTDTAQENPTADSTYYVALDVNNS